MWRAGLLLSVVVAGCALAGCTSASGGAAAGSASGRTTPSATGSVVHGCRITPVHTGPVPTTVPGFTGNGNPPWMGDADFAAVLWYAHDSQALMRAGGRMAPGASTKILWWVNGAADEPLVIHGEEATTGRTFTQRVDGIGGGQYPSIPVVPAAGCWTLSEKVGQHTAGAVTIAVGKAI